MPPRRRPTSSTFRRHQKADQILKTGLLVMRPYAYCVASSSLYVLSEVSEKCEQCHRFNRPYNLASPWAEVYRLLKQSDDLKEKMLEAKAKALRLRKQRRVILKKVRALGAREESNIEGLKINEAASAAFKPSAKEQPRAILSLTGLFQVSFNSFNRTSPVPTGSS
jgi:hypothetical protein